jgi:hypothetical protein
MFAIISEIFSWLAGRFRSPAELELEVIALRHQLAVLRRRRPGRARLSSIDRLIWVWLYRVWPRCLNVMVAWPMFCTSWSVSLGRRGCQWIAVATFHRKRRRRPICQRRVGPTCVVINPPAQDQAVEGAILRNLLDPPNYNALGNNCSQEVGNILRQGGLSAPSDLRPNVELHDLANQYQVPIRLY